MTNSATIVDIERRDYPSKHYVYVILTETASDKKLIFRRYNDFYELQSSLIQRFPDAAGQTGDRILPTIPGKILLGRSHIRDVAMQRSPELNDYLRSLLRLPVQISQSKQVENFLGQTSDDINASRELDSGKRSLNRPSISEPKAVPRARVSQAYTRKGAEEISVTVGQEVEVIEKLSSGWVKVHLDLQWGWVPHTCLTFNEETPVSGSCSFPALYLVVRGNTELGLRLGALVFVTEQRDDGWWKIEGYNGRVPGVCLAPVKQTLVEKVQAKLRKKEPPPRPPLPVR